MAGMVKTDPPATMPEVAPMARTLTFSSSVEARAARKRDGEGREAHRQDRDRDGRLDALAQLEGDVGGGRREDDRPEDALDDRAEGDLGHGGRRRERRARSVSPGCELAEGVLGEADVLRGGGLGGRSWWAPGQGCYASSYFVDAPIRRRGATARGSRARPRRRPRGPAPACGRAGPAPVERPQVLHAPDPRAAPRAPGRRPARSRSRRRWSATRRGSRSCPGR